MEIKQWHARFEWALAGFACLFVLLPKLVVLGFVALFVILILGYKKGEFTYQFNRKSALFLLFYAAYLIGVFFTHDMDQALKYVENKLAFILFPLFFSFLPKRGESFNLNKTYLGFIIGTTLISLLGIYNGFTCFLKTGDKICLLTTGISPYHHPTYLAVYLTFSMALVILGLHLKWKYFQLKWTIPFLIFAFILQGFLLSLAGLLFLFACIGAYLLFLLRSKFGKRVFYLALIIIPFFAYLAITRTPQISGEWYNAKKHAEEFLSKPEEYVKSRVYPMEGTEVRLTMWISTTLTIKEHVLGVGTGNVDEYLEKKLTQLGQPQLATHDYNPHNQFLQTFLEIGIFGLLILVFIIGQGIYLGVKYKQLVLLVLVSSLCFNSLFESMLQRQSGIIFYSFWFCILLANYYQSKRNIEA